jgi:hypothetical protein
LSINTAQFLLDFDRCFTLIPEWLEYELNDWKKSFAGYAALNALYQGKTPGQNTTALALEQQEIEGRYEALEAFYASLAFSDEETLEEIRRIYAEINEDEILWSYKNLITETWEQNKQEAVRAAAEKTKHWRQYLADEYLNEPDSLLARASSWKEGAMLDARDAALMNTGRINGAFALYSSRDERQNIRDTWFLLDNYDAETEKFKRYLHNTGALREELTRLGRGYEYTKMPPDVFKTELAKTYAALKERESAFNAARDTYLRAAESFADAGAAYDSRYTLVKKTFEALEEKRFEYEVQDAIRRWASTAYLDHETGDLTNCKDHLQKAQAVLAVLSDLYNNEERRPYDNPLYQALYSEYEKSFNNALVSHKVLNTLKAAIAEETINNKDMFAAYQTWINSLGHAPRYEENYVSSADRSGWNIKDIITLSGGRLVFSKDWTMRLDGIDVNEAKLLRDYFEVNKTAAGERHEISGFEIAVRELNERMAVYFQDAGRLSLWGLARDYFIRTLIDSNRDIGFLQNKYMRADAFMRGGSLANAPYKTGLFARNEFMSDYISGKQEAVRNDQMRAWNSLGESEKADLEFYIILTLSGGNDYGYGFSQFTALREFREAYDKAKKHYDEANHKVKHWPLIGLLYIETRDINKSTYSRVNASLEQTESYVSRWRQGLLTNIRRVKDYSSAYTVSCARLDALEGTAAPGQSIGWNEIIRSLNAASGLPDEEIALLKTCWDAMSRDIGGTYADVVTGLARLAWWTGNERNKNKRALEARWRLDDQNRQEKENNFLEITEDFLAGKSSVETLSAAAEAAYGADTAAWKNHFENTGKTLLRDLEVFPVYGSDYLAEFSELGSDYVSLIAKTFVSRYGAELAAREAEWEEDRRDLAEKYNAWRETAGLITERDREDWNISTRKMEAAYKQWNKNFIEEHKQVSAAWTEAYLAGLEDKEQWLEKAAAAADQASSEAFLSTVGAEAERMARFVDAREPLGIRDAVPETEDLLTKLLNTPGLGNISAAFGALNGMGNIAGVTVKRGMAGNGVWDSGVVRAAASDLARETNAELAAQEARRLAFSARSAAMEALKSLAANVDAANKNFGENMDRMYIVQGQWRKNGNRYIKDIVAGSTVFQPVITEQKNVESYRDYRMEKVTLKTNLDENYLAGLNLLAVRGLIENVYQEVEALMTEIFGNGDPREIHKQIWESKPARPGLSQTEQAGEWIDLQVRYLGSGKFGAHLGYDPAMRPSAGSADSRDALFYDQGSGETGRLLTDFYYWSFIDNNGIAKLSLAFWDKPIWDDRNSFFAAPSIRSAADVGARIGAGLISAALAAAGPATGGLSMLGTAALLSAVNSADDLLFGGLDAAFGYKTIDEAGFAFGKTALINAAGALSSGIFDGAANIAGNGLAAGQVLAQTAMSGVQTITTGLVTGAISGITYNHENGWGYSSEIFSESIRGTMTGALSSMTSTLTSGTLKTINSGIDLEKLTGLSWLNKQHLEKLNGLIGATAGQGMEFALGGDFTLNLLNVSLLTDGKVNTGLLELHLGRDGTPKMNIGTGGADVSPDTIVSAVKGALVWDVNNRIEKNSFEAKVILRAQYGFGDKDQLKQLRNILAGKDVIQIGTEGDFRAETKKVDSRRVITLNGYLSGMSSEDQMLFAALLGHEAYRDGVVTADNNLETRAAALAHTEMAIRMLQDGQQMRLDENLMRDLDAYFSANGDRNVFNAYVDSNYDSTADFWKLTGDGKLEYDGFATLRDMNGNIMRSYLEMGLKSDNAVEGALLYLMGVNQNDTAKVSTVRAMMEGAGLRHSFDADPNQWYWKGDHIAVVGNEDFFPITGTVDLTAANMGKTISIETMARSFGTMGAAGNDILKSVNRIYGSSIDFLNYADVGGKIGVANAMLSNYYTPSQLALVQANRNWLNNALKNGVDINSMVAGKAKRMEEFGVTTGDLELASSSVKGASYFQEDHTGIDFGSGGSAINGPGGYWQLTGKDGHKAYYQLYGGDLKMRIQHVNPNDLATIALDSAVYGGSNNKLLDYPTASYGSGTGAHIHIDMTMRLPYNGSYTRQFVNLETLRTGNRLEYQYAYMDNAKKKLPGNSGNFYRY